MLVAAIRILVFFFLTPGPMHPKNNSDETLHSIMHGHGSIEFGTTVSMSLLSLLIQHEEETTSTKTTRTMKISLSILGLSPIDKYVSQFTFTSFNIDR